MCVTDSRMLCCLPRSCLVHPVDHFDSEGWFSSDQMIFYVNHVLCFLVKKRAVLKWKEDAISGFPVSPGSAEALVRCGEKNKVCFDCLLSRQHFCQKLLQSNRVCKDYSKSKVGCFLTHSVNIIHVLYQYLLYALLVLVYVSVTFWPSKLFVCDGLNHPVEPCLLLLSFMCFQCVFNLNTNIIRWASEDEVVEDEVVAVSEEEVAEVQVFCFFCLSCCNVMELTVR